MKPVIELLLSESYNFNVVFRQGNTAFAAKLSLSPDGITFTVMADEHDDRKFEFLGTDFGTLTCDGLNQLFILHDLEMINSSSRAVSDDYKLWFTESSYKARHVIFCSGAIEDEVRYEGVTLISKTIGEWVGYTNKQNEIVGKYQNDDADIFDDLYEVVVPLRENEAVIVHYNLEIGGGFKDFKHGVTYEPRLDYLIPESNSYGAISAYTKTYNLLSFCCGFDPEIESIKLLSSDCSNAYLYVPSINNARKSYKRWILYPLGINTVRGFEYGGVPPLSNTVFETYFDETSQLPDIINKYIVYRRMSNVEDRFLGFFRLLEKETFLEKEHLDDLEFGKTVRVVRRLLKSINIDKKRIKAFDGAIKRANGAKYNTEKCLTVFYDGLPEAIKEALKFKPEVIAKMCKLRNDITHANHYSVTDHDIYKYTLHIEALLTLSLLNALGIELATIANIVDRLNPY